MSGTVTLRHVVNRQPKRVMYFYEGHLVARDGLLTIPLDKMHWVRRAWVLGYNHSPDGKFLTTFNAVRKEIERQTAESAKEDNEGTNRRRQPKFEDRIRSS